MFTAYRLGTRVSALGPHDILKCPYEVSMPRKEVTLDSMNEMTRTGISYEDFMTKFTKFCTDLKHSSTYCSVNCWGVVHMGDDKVVKPRLGTGELSGVVFRFGSE